MSESLKKKKESGHRALFLILITKWNTSSCKMKLIISYCSCNFKATSNKISQLPKSYVTSDKQRKINLILDTYQLKKNDKYSNWILCKYQSKTYFKRNRIDLKQQDQGIDKHTWISIRSPITRYLRPVEHQLT